MPSITWSSYFHFISRHLVPTSSVASDIVVFSECAHNVLMHVFPFAFVIIVSSGICYRLLSSCGLGTTTSICIIGMRISILVMQTFITD